MNTPDDDDLNARFEREITAASDHLFDAIAHGDEEHRAWLKEALRAYHLDQPVPPPRGSGNRDARIAELEAQLAAARGERDEAVRGIESIRVATEKARAAVVRECAEFIDRLSSTEPSDDYGGRDYVNGFHDALDVARTRLLATVSED